MQKSINSEQNNPKQSNIYPLCNIFYCWSHEKKKKKKKRKNRLNGYVHNVPVDYDDIDISGITDIYKKHNIVIYV